MSGYKSKYSFRNVGEINVRGESDFSRKIKTPIQRSQIELIKALDNFKDPDITDILKREILSDASRIDTFTNMNMKVLAVALLYLNRNRIKDASVFTPELFTDKFLNLYLQYLMEDFMQGEPEEQEIEEMRIKYKETLFRYIIKVLGSKEESPQSDSQDIIEKEIDENIEYQSQNDE